MLYYLLFSNNNFELKIILHYSSKMSCDDIFIDVSLGSPITRIDPGLNLDALCLARRLRRHHIVAMYKHLLELMEHSS